MSILVISSFVLGFIANLFFFWKRLKDDFSVDLIFSTGFLVLIGAISGLLISSLVWQEGWFWFGIAGSFIGFFPSIKKYKRSAHEVFEAYLMGILIWLTIMVGVNSIAEKNYPLLVGFVVLGSLIVLFLVLDARYRLFSWYRSGKVGFAGISVAAVFFLIRSAVAAFNSGVLSFVDRVIELPVSLGVFLMLTVTVYRLSKKK